MAVSSPKETSATMSPRQRWRQKHAQDNESRICISEIQTHNKERMQHVLLTCRLQGTAQVYSPVLAQYMQFARRAQS